MKLKKVSVISVNYNQPDLTSQFLSSLKKFIRYSNIEIIVVDNGSVEDHTESLSQKHPGVKFLRSDKNLGFAGGNNIGIRAASGDYLLFANNDTEFSDDMVIPLVQVLDADPAIGVVSPKILYFDRPEVIQYAGFTEMNYKTGRNKCIGQFEIDKGQYDGQSGQTAYAHGAAMMVRKEAIVQAGLMPEIFFLYYEELDWCEMIKRSGFSIWFEPAAKIYHKESASVGAASPRKEYYMTRNRILFIRRNASPVSLAIFCFYFILIVIPRNLIGHVRARRTDLISSSLKGIWWNIRYKKK